VEGNDADRRLALLRPPEVAEVTGLSVHTLAVWRTKNEGPRYVKVGRFVRYRSEDLDAWLESRAYGGGQ
jgi:excisionase family DNA binding protein